MAPASNQLRPNRFSIGNDLEFTLDCSIELCDVSAHSNAASMNQLNSPPSTTTSMPFRKQNSFEVDDSLGILTPDQMKEFLDSNVTNPHADMMLRFSDGGPGLPQQQCRIDATPSPEELPLDPIEVIAASANVTDGTLKHCMDDTNATMCRHPVELSISVAVGGVGTASASSSGDDASQTNEQPHSQHSDSDSKNDSMTKSTASKASNSFITSVTSIASLDTGYQGDGEMSRPASRGAGAHSPSGSAINGSSGRLGQMSVSRSGSQEQPQQLQQHQMPQREQQQRLQRQHHQQPKQIEEMLVGDGPEHQHHEHGSLENDADAQQPLMRPVIVPHRQARINDPMTDSDFFTESDADDVVNRNAAAGDRRAQVIDGQLYAGAGGVPMDGGAGGADVYIGRHGVGGADDANAVSLTEDSCMESSGIFTDVENRGDDDLGMVRSIEHDGREDSDDMSPDASTDTIKSQPQDRAGPAEVAVLHIVEGEC